MSAFAHNTNTVTFYPKDGVIYKGSSDDLDKTFANDYLATVQKDQKDGSLKFVDVSANLGETKRAMKKRQILQNLSKHRGYNASVHRELNAIEMSGAVNDSAIGQATIVQFVNKIIGEISNVNVVSKCFTTIQSNNLRGKIPEGGTPGITVQANRLTEAKITHADFGQSEFRIKRNDIHLFINREDRMEATIDPFAFSMGQGQKQAIQARDLLALKETSKLKKQTYGTISDPTVTTGTVAPRATNDVVDDFLEVYNEHFTKHRNLLKYFILNNRDYRAIQTNYYLRNNVKVAPAKGYGMVPFVGLEEHGIMACISPWAPRKTIYALCGEGAYELDGPKIVDSEYDVKNFGDYNVVRDFVGYHIPNVKRYGEKLSLTLDGASAGTEITTDGQIEELLTTPLVEKNDSA